jgi:peptide-N4-(N-acetyl-beta-glucosaminyl)asparagine amidase
MIGNIKKGTLQPLTFCFVMNSSDRCADPSAHHISIHGRPNTINSAHHDYSLKHTSAIPAMNHGGWVQCRIRYLTSIRTLEVALGGATVLTLHGLDLMAYLGQGDVCWFGFTASTGGLTQAHDLRWLSLHQYTSL